MSITFWNPENPAKFVEKYDPGYEELYSVCPIDKLAFFICYYF